MKLAATPLIRALPAASRPGLLASFKTWDLAPGGTLWKQGEPGDSIAVVLRGRCQLVRTVGDHEVVLAEAGPPTVIGALALLSPGPRAATLRADRPTRLAVLDGKTFTRIWSKNSPTAVQLQLVVARSLAEQLRNADKQLSSLLEDPVIELDDAPLRYVLRVVDHLCVEALRR